LKKLISPELKAVFTCRADRMRTAFRFQENVMPQIEHPRPVPLGESLASHSETVLFSKKILYVTSVHSGVIEILF